ncbi:MAG: hypothetical protein IKJ14_06230 [Clostridia bacterium]|nr:hypothetical protein [Clostridia bacterium]
MIDFLSIVSNVLFVTLVLSSIVFGISFSAKIFAVKTVKNLVRESDRIYDNIGDIEKTSRCDIIVKNKIEKYLLYHETARKNKKINRRNKIRKFFRLKEIKPIELNLSIKQLSLSLLKEVTAVFEGAGGYLNYSKNEFISMLKTLIKRLDLIFESSGVIWLKTLKISTALHFVDVARSVSKFKGKTFVVIVSAFFEFCFFISRFISPVGASKKLANNVFSNSFSSLLVSSVFNIAMKEWAVLCYEKEKSRLDKKSFKKVA